MLGNMVARRSPRYTVRRVGVHVELTFGTTTTSILYTSCDDVETTEQPADRGEKSSSSDPCENWLAGQVYPNWHACLLACLLENFNS